MVMGHIGNGKIWYGSHMVLQASTGQYGTVYSYGTGYDGIWDEGLVK